MELKVDGRRVFAATGGRPFDRAEACGRLSARCGMRSQRVAAAGALVRLAWVRGAGRRPAGSRPLRGATPYRRSQILLNGSAACSTRPASESAALVGHSMGGAVALETAATLGRRIGRLALLGTAASIPVNDILLSAAREEPQRAYQMMTAWAHGASAKLGGNPAPGLVDDRRHHGAVRPQRGGRSRRRSRRLQCLDIRSRGSEQDLRRRRSS